jgi:dTDP-4-dehydrorhamnose 3,5-epimerase
VPGAWLLTPTIHADERGDFLEWYRTEEIPPEAGHRGTTVQANQSRSRRGVVRGIHFADVPPGQSKHVFCVRGTVFDVVVDVRVGSPTFGTWAGAVLDDRDRRAVYVSEGLGHGFMALTDDATVIYLCSERYAPERERAVHALDPAIGIEWPLDVPPVLSAKDAQAPTLADAPFLPRYSDCIAWYARQDG